MTRCRRRHRRGRPRRPHPGQHPWPAGCSDAGGRRARHASSTTRAASASTTRRCAPSSRSGWSSRSCRTPCPTRSCGSSTPSADCSPRWRRPTRASAGPSATASCSRWSMPNCCRARPLRPRRGAVGHTGWRPAPRPPTASPSSSPTARQPVRRARYVVGCDGGRSATRRLMGVSFDGTTSSTRWLVVDLRERPAGPPEQRGRRRSGAALCVDLDRPRHPPLRVHDPRRRVRRAGRGPGVRQTHARAARSRTPTAST